MLNPDRGKKHQKVERREKVRCEKRNKACALQRGVFPKKTFRHEINMLCSEEHEIHGVQLNKMSLSPFDSKRYIAEKRHGHICIWLPFDRRRALCFTMVFWRKFRLKGYNQQLTYEASFGSILQIIQYRFTGVGNRFLNVVDFQRPDWICGSFSSTFHFLPYK